MTHEHTVPVSTEPQKIAPPIRHERVSPAAHVVTGALPPPPIPTFGPTFSAASDIWPFCRSPTTLRPRQQHRCQSAQYPEQNVLDLVDSLPHRQRSRQNHGDRSDDLRLCGAARRWATV